MTLYWCFGFDVEETSKMTVPTRFPDGNGSSSKGFRLVGTHFSPDAGSVDFAAINCFRPFGCNVDEEVKVEDTTLFTWERLCTEVALSVKNVNARARTVTERMSTLTYCDFHCIILNTGSSCAHVKSSKHCACVGERGGMLEVYAPSPLTLMIMEEEANVTDGSNCKR